MHEPNCVGAARRPSTIPDPNHYNSIVGTSIETCKTIPCDHLAPATAVRGACYLYRGLGQYRHCHEIYRLNQGFECDINNPLAVAENRHTNTY